jgi:hypothetical protein
MIQLRFTVTPPFDRLIGHKLRPEALLELADPRRFATTMLCAISHVIVNGRNVDMEDKERSPEDHQMPAD